MIAGLCGLVPKLIGVVSASIAVTGALIIDHQLKNMYRRIENERSR